MLIVAALAGCRSQPSENKPKSGKKSASSVADLPQHIGPPSSQPDVVLITLDTTRGDYVTPETMPFFCEFAGHGVDYRAAQTVFSETGPAHATLLSGVRVSKHGIVCNGKKFTYPVRLPISFKRAGYQTGGFVSAVPVRAEFGFGLGFDKFDDEEDFVHQPDLHRRGVVTVRRALAWYKKRNHGWPAFMWVHLFEAHASYDPPDLKPGEQPVRRAELEAIDYGRQALEPASCARIRGMYRRELRAMDDEIKHLVETVAAGSTRGVLWCVVGDHGEELFDHEHFAEHDRSLYQGVLHVPLCIRWDGVLPPLAVSAPVSTGSMAATLLKLAHLPAPPIGYAPLPLRVGDTVTDLPLIARRAPNYHWSGGPATSIRLGKYKAIFYYEKRSMELYDLAKDPHERTNLAAAYPKVVDWLQEKVKSVAPLFIPTADVQIDPNTQRRLRALGYMQ